MKRLRHVLIFALTLALAACSTRLADRDFANSGVPFDPVSFFTGHVASWGVEEGRGGAPIGIVTTDCTGILAPNGDLTLVQTLHVGADAPQKRIWQMHRIDPSHYTATANDMAGTADGTVSGRMLHWRWVLETKPGQALKNVTMEQWMYHMDDGSVMIRTIVTKLGVRLIEVSEVFQKA